MASVKQYVYIVAAACIFRVFRIVRRVLRGQRLTAGIGARAVLYIYIVNPGPLLLKPLLIEVSRFHQEIVRGIFTAGGSLDLRGQPLIIQGIVIICADLGRTE